MDVPSSEELTVTRLGECEYASPLNPTRTCFVKEEERTLLFSDTESLRPYIEQNLSIPSFETAGPRQNIFFGSAGLTCGIVTCGGICPGLNDVIRSITLTLRGLYGVQRVLGFRYGFAGLAPDSQHPPLDLTDKEVDNIQVQPGTILGSSRGPQDPGKMVDTLENYGISILFTIGGDGTLAGASALAAEIAKRKLPISVIGVPKTIDNDLNWIMRSFGFSTAVQAATTAVEAAHCEAKCAWNGVGLVKLMGRDSGFIAAHSTVSTGVVNFCLIPEVPFILDGENGFLRVLERRLGRKRHAVIVTAEGAGQNLFEHNGEPERDASGNIKHKDIGLYLKERIERHFEERQIPMTIKYIDPSYTIRSLPANAIDSEFCVMLGQQAVHAGMAGRTDMVIGVWNQNFTHLPIRAIAGKRKHVDPLGEIWQTVVSTTHQPDMSAKNNE